MISLEQCASHVRSMDAVTERNLTRYLVSGGMLPGHVGADDLLEACLRARLCQADVVLGLLRLNTPRSLGVVELMVGRTITRCPSTLRLRSHKMASPELRTGDERLVIVRREPEPVEHGRRRLLSTPMYARLALARVGMSVGQLVARGLRRRDLRCALTRGWLVLEAAS